MSELHLLKQFQDVINDDIALFRRLLKAKEDQYVQVSMAVMMMEQELNGYAEENNEEPIIINCDPPDEVGEINKE